MLLNLAAALQLQAWENLGFQGNLPPDLASARSAFRFAAEIGINPNQHQEPLSIPCAVIKVWFERFARNSHQCGLREIMHEHGSDSDEVWVDALARLLWQQRKLMESEKEHK